MFYLFLICTGNQAVDILYLCLSEVAKRMWGK
jgi:hypothetical protein